MTCANCASRVEKNLARVNGVQEVSVNLATEKAKVSFDPTKVDVNTLAETIKRIGYEVPISHAAPLIVGHDLRRLRRPRIEKHLSKEPGVVSASVNLATDSASIGFIPGVTDVPALIKAVESIGYKARDANPTPRSTRSGKPTKKRSALSATASSSPPP